MGVLADKYKKANEEYQAFYKEPIPDKATQQMEYFEYSKRERANKRKHMHVNSVMNAYPFKLDQVKYALEKALPEDQRKKIMAFQSDMNYKIGLGLFVKETHPELIEGLSTKEKEDYKLSPTQRADIIHKWVEEGKITQEEYDSALAKHLKREAFRKTSRNPELEEKFINALDETLNEEQKKEIIESIDNYKDPLDVEEAERVTHPYENQVNELLKQIPPEIVANPEKLKLYTESLEYAKANLTEPKPEIKQEYQAYENNNQEMEVPREKFVREQLCPNFEGGKYDQIFERTEYNKQFLVVREGKEDEFNEIIQNGIQLSEKTKNGMRRIMKKMEEMGLENYPYVENGEDGGKIYSFSKLAQQKKAFIAALDKGNPDEIIQTKQEYEKTVKDMEELYQISRETFPQDKGLFPGNLDSVRNSGLPFELTSDVRNTGYVNAIYQGYMTIKTKGLGMEEYLQNPSNGILRNAEQKWQENSFETVSQKATTLEETMDLMSDSGKFYEKSLALQQAYPTYGFGRQISNPKYLEVDPDQMAKNDIVTLTISEDVLSGALNSESDKFTYFTKKSAHNELENQKRLETLGNLILAKDEDRKPSAMFAGCAETDVLGRRVSAGFDAESYVKQTPVDYTGIINRAHRVQKHADELSRNDQGIWINEKLALEATRQLYTKVLLAHPEDMEKPGYKKMQQDLNQTLDRMAELDQEDLGALAKENKEILNDMLAENRRNYLIHNEPVEELRRLEAEAIRTGDFSKYAAFLVDVEAASNDLKPEASSAYSKYLDEIIATDRHHVPLKGMDFYNKLCYAVNEIDMEAGVKLSMKSEEMAQKIRNGEVKVDPAYDDVKTDYRFSRILANQIINGCEEDRIRTGTDGICSLLLECSPRIRGERYFDKARVEQEKEFYRNGKVAGSAGERRHYLADAQSGFRVYLGDVNPDGSVVLPKVDDIEDRLEKSAARTADYRTSLEKLKSDAQEKLDAMNEERLGGREGSDQYKAMYDALEAITRLNAENTPLEVQQSIENLRLATEDYKRKIEDQGIFARFRQRGKDRYDFADGVEEFAWNNAVEFSEKATDELSANEKISVQVERANNNRLAFAAKQAKDVVKEVEERQAENQAPEAAPAQEKQVENQAPEKAPAAPAQKKAKEYLADAKVAEEALNGMGKGIQNPEGTLWEEKMDAFIKVATAKEIERRGGLKEGETIQSVQKQLFGEKEAREAVTQMAKEYNGKQLIELAGKQEFGKTLKAYQEKQKNISREEPEKKVSQLEKPEETRKRSKSVVQKSLEKI